jgi:integrase
MNEYECKVMCTNPEIPIREKTYFRVIYETQLRPVEALNLQIENWDRNQRYVTALKVKQKTRPMKGNRHEKVRLESKPKTREITPATNEMIRNIAGNRKKGAIFVNEAGKQITLRYMNKMISHHASLLGIQKDVRHYVDGRTRKLVTCMALREAGERHHDNAGGSRKLSAVVADHTMQVKERHYEKTGDDPAVLGESYRKFHPAWNW